MNFRKCQKQVLSTNCQKIKSLSDSFDSQFPKSERLPRRFVVNIVNVIDDGPARMKAFINGKQVGDDLTDNAYSNDGYRFHDVFHFAFAAVLGWSPVARRLLKCKRKSNLLVDEVEDGGRAAAIEEGICAIVFDYARQHDFLDGVSELDDHLLKTVKSITSHLEVSKRTVADWKMAIFMGCEVWRQIEKNLGGGIIADLDARSISYVAS